MPAPLAKGIIVGVSVLVAAGIAVYESPQFRRWVNQSRRKIAMALYSLGDEIHPQEPFSQDISMTEEASEDAAERRRKAREEIAQRREFMQSRRGSAAVSFDALVDKDGKLRSEKGEVIYETDESIAQSTALDTTAQSISLHRRGGSPGPEALTDARLQTQREMMEAMERERLHLDLPSEASSTHPSESLIDLTPTSEFPETNQETLPSHQDRTANPEYFSIPSLSNSTHNSHIGQQPEYFYAHPNQSDRSSAESTNAMNPFQDHDLSTASSVAGSLDHVHEEISSDGTLSEWGQPTDGVLTPASWSEVGSVISSDEEHHHQ